MITWYKKRRIAQADACANSGHELKQRQYDRQTQKYPKATTDQVISPQKSVPGYEMINNPISVNPTIHQTTPSINPQLQKNINMKNRLQRSPIIKRRSPIILRDNEGLINVIINR